MVAVTCAFSGCLGSSVSVASNFRNCEVKCEKPRWFTRKVRLACEGSRRYSPAGTSVATGLMDSGTADSVGCAKAAATRMPIARSRYMRLLPVFEHGVRAAMARTPNRATASHRFFADHHPVRPKAIAGHAPALGEEGFRHGHAHSAAFRERGEDALGFLGRVDMDADRIALRLVVTAARRIGTH